RLQDLSGSQFSVTINNGSVGDFSIYLRRWDNSPEPDYTAEYSTNSGVTWNNVTTLNNAWFGNSDYRELTFTINSISVSATTDDIIVRISRNGGERIMIDDVSWTCYSCPSPPADPIGSITGDTPSCDDTVLNYSSPDATIYWQTTADGTSTTNPTTSPYLVTTSGTYYVRTFDGTCWSDNAVSYPVVINYPPTITTQPVS